MCIKVSFEMNENIFKLQKDDEFCFKWLVFTSISKVKLKINHVH